MTEKTRFESFAGAAQPNRTSSESPIFSILGFGNRHL